MISIDDLFTAPTADQQLEQFLSILETIGVRARSWRKGGVYRTILRVVAITYAAFAAIMLLFIRGFYLETSERGWLTLLAYFFYGVTRPEATFATGQALIVNAGGFVGDLNPDEFRIYSSITNKVYRNTALIHIAPTTGMLIDVQAVEVGSASSAPPFTIDTLETAIPGVTVSNPAAVVGSDAMADPDLRQLCKDKLAVLGGKGPRGAYAYAVRTATRPDGSLVDVNRISISPSSSTGVVTIYVASPAGAPSSLDLGYIAANIELLARPDTVTVNLFAATPVAFAKTLTVWAIRQDGVSAADLATLVGNALIPMISGYPIGGIPKPPATQGYLWTTTIDGTIKAAHPSIYAVDGLGSDLAMSAGQVATLATTLTIRLTELQS